MKIKLYAADTLLGDTYVDDNAVGCRERVSFSGGKSWLDFIRMADGRFVLVNCETKLDDPATDRRAAIYRRHA